MDKNLKEKLYQKLSLVLQLVEDRNISEATQHLEELIHRVHFDQL
jgi:hypothetical protein